MLVKSLKTLAKAVISPLVDATGLYERRIHEAVAVPGGWTIAMYHRVIDDAALDPFGLGMCVMRDRFEQQMRYLRSAFNILSVGEAVRRLEAGEALPERCLSITFDDGYLDNLTHAMPVLEGLQVPFTIYVPTGGLDAGEMLWWDRVIATMAATDKPALDLAEAGLSATPEPVPLTGLARAAAVDRVLDQLWALDMPAATAAVDRIERVLGSSGREKTLARRLSPAQVRDLHRRGVEIGAHSVHHPNLSLACDELSRREMQESRRYLEALLQAPVTGFAYPGGRMRSVTARIAQEVGFAYALSTDTGVNQPPHDRLRLKRIGMPDAGLADFRRAFSGALLRNRADLDRRF